MGLWQHLCYSVFTAALTPGRLNIPPGEVSLIIGGSSENLPKPGNKPGEVEILSRQHFLPEFPAAEQSGRLHIGREISRTISPRAASADLIVILRMPRAHDIIDRPRKAFERAGDIGAQLRVILPELLHGEETSSVLEGQ